MLAQLLAAVAGVDGGMKALEVLKSQSGGTIELVILALNLPEMSRLESLARMPARSPSRTASSGAPVSVDRSLSTCASVSGRGMFSGARSRGRSSSTIVVIIFILRSAV